MDVKTAQEVTLPSSFEPPTAQPMWGGGGAASLSHMALLSGTGRRKVIDTESVRQFCLQPALWIEGLHLLLPIIAERSDTEADSYQFISNLAI